MPDLDIVPMRYCVTREQWSVEVPSSKTKTTYTVRFEKLKENQRNLRLCDYDFTCTCPHFQHRLQWQGRGYCKHIHLVKAGHCGWSEANGGGPAVDVLTDEEKEKAREEGRCPVCGAETRVTEICQ